MNQFFYCINIENITEIKLIFDNISGLTKIKNYIIIFVRIRNIDIDLVGYKLDIS